MTTFSKVLCFSLGLFCPALSMAQDALRLSGYGTAGLSWDDRRDVAPTRDISQRPIDADGTRAGFGTAPNWRLDSRLGLQVDYRFDPALELVAQVVLRDHVKANLPNSFEAAYAGWRPAPDVDVRAGRLAYDVFLMSDTRHLGYAYPWVRPPTEFYGWIPIFSVDGIDAAYRAQDWRVKLQLGRSKFSVPVGDANNYDFASSGLLTASVSRQSGPWRIKAAYSRFQVATDADALDSLRAGLDQLAAGVPLLAAEASDIRRNLSFKGTRVGYSTIGAVYDDGQWMLQGELGHSTSSVAIIPHGNLGYIGVARRMDDWTVFAMLSGARPANAVRTPRLDWAVIGQAGFQAQALQVLNSTRMAQDSVALGVRRDLGNQVSLKLQWNHSRVQANGYGLWWRDLTLNPRASRINLWSANVDFVF